MIMKSVLAIFVSLFSLSVHAQNFERKTLYYDVAAFKLNDAQKKILDSVVVFYSNRRISINGHADYSGTEGRNELVAELRAKAVLRYLVDRGFPETQVMNATGLGKSDQIAGTTAGGKEDAANRRVDIFITKGAEMVGKLKEVAPPEPPKVYVAKEPPKNVTKIDYSKLKVGDIVALKNISFIPGTDQLMPEAFEEIQNLFEVLMAHPTLKVRLEGHVCCVVFPDGYEPGTVSWILSENRAMRVQTLLIEKGISVARLSYKGFGRTQPLFEEELTRNQQQGNRRVEIRIISR
jgi:outer membrane protein OmpA-like peptidoglycan-associated protein